MGLFRSLLPILVALSLWLGSVSGVTAEPRDELLQLVPDDVSLCFVVNNLRDHSQRLLKMPWLTKLKGTALGKDLLKTPELDKLRKVDQDLQLFAQVSWQQIQDELLGDCVVFAFRHSDQGKPQDERGLVMLWARDTELLDKLIELINSEQKKNGELKEIVEKEHKGVKYAQRQEPKQKQFYLRLGPIFAFTTHEPMLLQVIERYGKTPPPLSPVQKSVAKLKADHALVTFWLNPRAFDAQWKPAAQDNTDTAAAKQAFNKYWQALDAVAVTLEPGKEMQLQLTLQGRPGDLPVPAQKFLQAALQPSDLWQKLPAKAALTAAGRVDGEALLQMLEDFMPPAARAKLHEGLQEKLNTFLSMDFIKDVLPNLGPDVGICIAPAANGQALPHVLFALRIKPGARDTPVDEAVLKAVNNAAVLAMFAFNSKQKKLENHLALKSVKQGQVEVKYLTQAQFPPGLQPAFALKEGYLVLATSPDAIQRFGQAGAKVTGAPLIQVSFAEVAGMLKAQSPWLLANVPAPPPPQPAGKWLDDVLEVLAVFDSLSLQQQTTPGQATWSVRLKTTTDK